LKQLEQIPNAKIFGMTGILTMDDKKIIRRRLPWAQIRSGQLMVNPQVIDPMPAPGYGDSDQ
jgi:outer membrane PBP1 activator LpoA protein